MLKEIKPNRLRTVAQKDYDKTSVVSFKRQFNFVFKESSSNLNVIELDFFDLIDLDFSLSFCAI